MTFWDWLIIALFGWFMFKLGQIAVSVRLYQVIKRHAEGQDLDMEELLDRKEETLTVERYNGQYLAYGDNLGFLAQGDSFKEMFERVRTRFPGQQFRVKNYQAQFSEEEAKRMVSAIFETFGDQNDKSN